jgi:hypothetical protein
MNCCDAMKDNITMGAPKRQRSWISENIRHDFVVYDVVHVVSVPSSSPMTSGQPFRQVENSRRGTCSRESGSSRKLRRCWCGSIVDLTQPKAAFSVHRSWKYCQSFRREVQPLKQGWNGSSALRWGRMVSRFRRSNGRYGAAAELANR